MLTDEQKEWIKAHSVPKASRLKKGPAFGDIFVHMPDGFLCQACVIHHKIDVGDEDVNVWLVGSNGWLAPCVCSDCKLSIPVMINGCKDCCQDFEAGCPTCKGKSGGKKG